MSTTERRVSELLHAYGEELQMTDHDIERLEQDIERQHAHDRTVRTRTARTTPIVQAAVAACAVAGVVLGILALRDRPAPAPSGPPPVPTSQLAGIWRLDDGSGWLWRFTPDGKLLQSRSPDLLTATVPSDASAVRPAPGGFVVQDPADDPACVGSWTATISTEGRLVAREPDETAACPGDNGVVDPPAAPWLLTRVSPVSAAGAAIVPGKTVWQPRAVQAPAFLTGTWLLRGTGTLLTVDASAAYAVQDLGTGGGAVTGTVAVGTDGTVTFTPKGSTSCPATYASATYSETQLDIALATGSCGRLGGSTDSWVRLN